MHRALLPEVVRVVEDVRVQVDRGAVDEELAELHRDLLAAERDLAVARHALRDVARVLYRLLDLVRR